MFASAPKGHAPIFQSGEREGTCVPDHQYACGQIASGPLFGWMHFPDDSRGSRTGVIPCNPFGVEQILTHRLYLKLAERLAQNGHWALRFDYHGTGDSAGDDEQPRRVRSWMDSIDRGVNLIKRTGGVHEVCLFGLRLGATLAFAAAEECGGQGISGIVL
jgi:alpha-beta hydrolase superfamily lysophospholipase